MGAIDRYSVSYVLYFLKFGKGVDNFVKLLIGDQERKDIRKLFRGIIEKNHPTHTIPNAIYIHIYMIDECCCVLSISTSNLAASRPGTPNRTPICGPVVLVRAVRAAVAVQPV